MVELNVVSFLLGLAALIVLLIACIKSPRATWAGVPLGLLLFVAAWLLQSTWNTPHNVHF